MLNQDLLKPIHPVIRCRDVLIMLSVLVECIVPSVPKLTELNAEHPLISNGPDVKYSPERLFQSAKHPSIYPDHTTVRILRSTADTRNPVSNELP